jgi:hypothetical protein
VWTKVVSIINSYKGSTKQVIIVSILSYTLSSLLLNATIDDQIMFDGFLDDLDSYSYLKVGQWILGGEATYHIGIRPFLFSFIVGLLYTLGGSFMVWIYQLIAYLIAHLLLVKSIRVVTEKDRYVRWCSLLYLINFSLVGLTYHALAETTVVCGFSILLYLSAKVYKNKIEKGKYYSWTIFILALLIVVKPVFFYPFLLFIFLAFFQVIRKKMTFKEFRKLPLLIALLALCAQYAIMYANFHVLKISFISEITYKNYLLSQVIMEESKVDRVQAIALAKEMSAKELSTYSVDHFGQLMFYFLKNLRENIQSDPFFQSYSDESVNGFHTEIMKFYNKTSLYIQLFILFAGAYLVLNRKKITSPMIHGTFVLLWLLLFYYIFVTGISFDQRDRLVMGALPLWIFFLLAILHTLLPFIRKKREEQKMQKESHSE